MATAMRGIATRARSFAFPKPDRSFAAAGGLSRAPSRRRSPAGASHFKSKKGTSLITLMCIRVISDVPFCLSTTVEESPVG